MAWSVVAVLALLLQGLLVFAPAKAADGFALDAAAICSVAGKMVDDTGKAHDPSASHCPLCQNLQPSLGLSPPAVMAILPQAKPLGLARPVSPVMGQPFQPVGFLSRAPPVAA